MALTQLPGTMLSTVNTLTSASATNLTLQAAGNTAITILPSGNVGVGTTSPGSLLTVNGSVNATSMSVPSSTMAITPVGGSLLFSSNYLTLPAAAGTLGTGNWTIECWWKWSYTSQNYATIISKGIDSTGAQGSWSFGVRTSGDGLWFAYAGTTGSFTNVQSSNSCNDGNWHHLAVTLNGTTLTLWMDGVSQITATTPASFNFGGTVSNSTLIGYNTRNAAYVNGWVSNLRVIVGTALYNSNFVPPTAPLTAITNTQLLLNVASSGSYITDSSTNAYTSTPTNNVSYASQTPFYIGSLAVNGSIAINNNLTVGGTITFADNTTQTTAALGGGVASQINPFNDSTQIAYFPLNGNFLDLMGNLNGTVTGTVPFSSAGNKFGYTSPLFSAGNYFTSTSNVGISGAAARTVSCWVKLSSRVSSNDPQGIVAWGVGSSNNTYALVSHISSSYQWGVWGYSNDSNSGILPDLNWHFLTHTYDGNMGLIYLDGQVIFRTTSYTLATSNTALNIGTVFSSSSYYFPGYVNSVRIFNRALNAYEIQQLQLYGR